MWPLRTICCIISPSRTFLSRNTKIWSVDLWKNGFYPISRYLFILGHMLLHELYINVAIANIFHHAPALKDLRKLNN